MQNSYRKHKHTIKLNQETQSTPLNRSKPGQDTKQERAKQIKGAFYNWNKLKNPGVYKQTALYSITKNFMEPRILHKLNDIWNKTETNYTTLCNTCLKEEDCIMHKLFKCPPIRYLNDDITNSTERLGARNVAKKTKQLDSVHTFPRHSPLARKNQNKETRPNAVANIATTTVRRIWLHQHLRKPTSQFTQQIARQTIRSVTQTEYK